MSAAGSVNIIADVSVVSNRAAPTPEEEEEVPTPKLEWTCPVCWLDWHDNRDTMVPTMLLGCRTMTHGICARCALDLRRANVSFKCPTCRAEALMIVPIKPLVKETEATKALLLLLTGDSAAADLSLSPVGRFLHSWVYVALRVVNAFQNVAVILIILGTCVTLIESASTVILLYCEGLVSALARIADANLRWIDAGASALARVAIYAFQCLEIIFLGLEIIFQGPYFLQEPFLTSMQCPAVK